MKGAKRELEQPMNDDSVIIPLVGMRVLRYNGNSYEVGGITKVVKGKGGMITKIVIAYDTDKGEEEHTWPDKDITLTGGGRENTTSVTSKKKLKGGEDKTDDKNVKMFGCGEEGCEYKTKQAGHLKTHKASVHDIDVTYFVCDVNGCQYKVKQAGNLKTHKANVRDIDVASHKAYFLCDVNGCKYKAKVPGSVKLHRAYVHDIDVTYFLCGVEDCEYKAKTAGDVKKHKARIHGISLE